ncbi:LamG-like jellyroll fold domain-containing protein [Pleionea sp. CnH1-48]|uniref:LamG-like jellyroll fold domain-containing protein n=1 Tax=Pleionea sp. CnH1-48 TaxID=2954494 RepID=UPI00209719C9|nr:LamG-like jellyroll fold domain-containing protein [Pleionea sp. CnH1-48]MCO7224111.1 winged helix-turn-helix domain-containing protein [Pleionea sp. CnH1-48]
MNSTKFLINDCLVDIQQNSISQNNEVKQVEPRIISVLEVLIDNAGQLVLREDLIRRVWEDQVVNENSLNRNIAKIRKILDKDNETSCIKTVPKKGYILTAKVQVSAEPKLHNEVEKAQKTFNISTKPLTSFFLAASLLFVISVSIAIKPDTSLQLNSSATSAEEKEASTTSASINTKQHVTLSPENQSTAFCLDGIDDYVEVKNSPIIDVGTNDFSLSAWIRTRAKGLIVILDKRSEKNVEYVKGYHLFVTDGKLGFQLAKGEGSWSCQSNPPISSCSNYIVDKFIADGQWHLVNVTVDRDHEDGIKFYIDGKYIRRNNPMARSGSLSNDSPLRIGSRSSDVSGLFHGDIAEVSIHNYSLSEDEINDMFSRGVKRGCQLAKAAPEVFLDQFR